MCGIAGYVGQGDVDQLTKACDALKLRGPDDSGIFQDAEAGLAFRRLSIIDLEGGHQPMSNESGTVHLVFNGEIYGYKQLRDELKADGFSFTTSSDTEVVLRAYEKWGEGCFEKLAGMFAIAIWDAKRSVLLLARDRLGKKPLYWTRKGETLWFASEIKALVAAGATLRKLDYVSLTHYFETDFIPTTRSIYQDISKLAPATVLRFSKDGIHESVFWKPEFSPVECSEPELLQDLRARIDESVRDRLVSDVPLGLFLSGGIDSTLIAESAARLSSSRLKAFVIGFEQSSYDERPAARAIANALGIELEEALFSSEDAKKLLPDAAYVFDEPLADPSILPQLAVAKAASSELKVVLTGDGGDELLLGYQHIPAHLFLNRFRIPNPFLASAASVLNAVPAGHGYFSLGFKTQRLARGLASRDPWERDLRWRGSFGHENLLRILSDRIRQECRNVQTQRFMQLLADEISQASFETKWSWTYLRSYLMDDVLVKVDRATMANGLEARSPLLDASLVERMLRIPSSLKTGQGSGKKLFKTLLHGRVPADVLERKKHGFTIPIGRWLTNEFAPQLSEVSNPTFLKTQGLFDPAEVQRLIEQHRSAKVDRRKELWAFLHFQLWFRTWNPSL